MKRGLLLTLTEPPPDMEEEFNAWFDDEHLGERLAIPGFRSAQRWAAEAPRGAGKYLATYELDSIDVLSSPAYLARYQNQTPWSRRCLGKALVCLRAARALLLNAFVPDSLQIRRFRASTGEEITLCELSAPQASPGLVYRRYQP
jgi:hypothetical protein